MNQSKRRIFIHEDDWGMRNLYPVDAYDEAEAEMDESIAASERNRSASGLGWDKVHVFKAPKIDFADAGLSLSGACAVLAPFMPRVHIFDAALPQAPNDPYGVHETEAYCFGIDETCFVKLEPKSDLVGAIWFEAPIGDQTKLSVLRSALLAIDAVSPAIVADYWTKALGEVSDPEFLDAYFDLLASQVEQ